MARREFLGTFEQMILLAILQQGEVAHGPRISRELESSTGRSVSRGALYTTLDRLEQKGLLAVSTEPGGLERSGLPKRLYRVTPKGVAALRLSRKSLLNLWRGLEEVLDGPEVP